MLSTDMVGTLYITNQYKKNIMFLNKNCAEQTLTDAGIIYLDPELNIEDNFEGSVLFTVTGTEDTGTYALSAQLQGSNSEDFSTGVADLGSPVTPADTVLGVVALSGTLLAYAYYRVEITGSGTQSTAVIGTVTIKGRN